MTRDKNKLTALSAEEIDNLVTELKRPIVLAAASGDWIPACDAMEMVEEICGVGSDKAIKAICRRAVSVIPVPALIWRELKTRTIISIDSSIFGTEKMISVIFPGRWPALDMMTWARP